MSQKSIVSFFVIDIQNLFIKKRTKKNCYFKKNQTENNKNEKPN